MRTNYTADELLDTIGTGANWEADVSLLALEGAVAKWNELGLRHMRPGIAKAGTKRGERSRIAHEAPPSARLTLVADHPYWYDTPRRCSIRTSSPRSSRPATRPGASRASR